MVGKNDRLVDENADRIWHGLDQPLVSQPAFLEPALELYREARARGAKVSKGSATKLIGACAQAGEEKAAAEVIRVAGGSLDGALDILYGLIRQPHEPHAARAE